MSDGIGAGLQPATYFLAAASESGEVVRNCSAVTGKPTLEIVSSCPCQCCRGWLALETHNGLSFHMHVLVGLKVNLDTTTFFF